MKRGIVYCCGEKAGELVRDDEGYLFRYDPLYFADSTKPGVAATPTSRTFRSSEASRATTSSRRPTTC